MKRALITGITGQDGSYLAELLLSKDYEVFGMKRLASSSNTSRINHLLSNPRLKLLYGDLGDPSSLNKALWNAQPDEVYHLGAQSHVRVSFDVPEYTADVTGVGTVRLLQSIREMGLPAKFYNAASSEMFGNSHAPQNERTPFQPCSPYAAAKVYAYGMTRNYREAYGMFACSGILFNHESPRRGENFVTRKITQAAARIKFGLQDKLFLGNLDAYRDWGYAGDYVEAMWLMLQKDCPEDYVIATGETHSVREFLDGAFGDLELDWHKYVEIDPLYYRPTEVNVLRGDATKARKELGWMPRVDFYELVRMMTMSDFKVESQYANSSFSA